MEFAFKSDGCSVVSDLDSGMRRCCVYHDVAYWRGGTAEDRARADRILRACIQVHSKYKILAWVRWFGVRIGGAGWLPTPFRWGFGWKWPATDGVGGPYTIDNQREAIQAALRKT